MSCIFPDPRQKTSILSEPLPTSVLQAPGGGWEGVCVLSPQPGTHSREASTGPGRKVPAFGILAQGSRSPFSEAVGVRALRSLEGSQGSPHALLAPTECIWGFCCKARTVGEDFCDGPCSDSSGNCSHLLRLWVVLIQRQRNKSTTQVAL